MEPPAPLRPLDEVAEPIRQLEEYRSDAELNAAIDAVAAAAERSLRLALRTDPDAPADHRLSALSPDALPLERVVQSLRARDVISLETAGALHELAASAARALGGEAAPGDADVAVRAVARLRADLGAAAAARVGPEPTVTPAAPTTLPAGPTDPVERPTTRPDGGRWMAWIGAALALLFVLGLAWVLTSGGGDHYESGIAAFRAARWDSAAASFERALEDRPVDVTSMLYLARSYRRLGRLQDAGDVLREAVRVAPDDADVRRELGRLFMDLGRPGPAIEQFERALELDPESAPTWAALIQALRAADDPRAERMLERAPPEVRAGATPNRIGETPP